MTEGGGGEAPLIVLKSPVRIKFGAIWISRRPRRTSGAHLAGADVFPEAVLRHHHLQAGMALPGVPVGGVLPAAGPGGQLDAGQQETQAQGHAHLSDGRAAAAWRRGEGV